MMRFVLYTYSYSPHEMPLFLACAEVFEHAIYVVDQDWISQPSRKGWKPNLCGRDTLVLGTLPKDEREKKLRELLTIDTVILYGQRGNPYEDLIQRSRSVVLYASERWLKPDAIRIPGTTWRIPIPGSLHLLRPDFRRCVRNMRRWVHENNRFFYFAEGIHAARDMALLVGKPRTHVKRRLGWHPLEIVDNLPWLRIWGYFVSSSDHKPSTKPLLSKMCEVRVLWVGRMIPLKHVDSIIKAVLNINNRAREGKHVELTLVGEGPEKPRLERLASKTNEFSAKREWIKFLPFVPMNEVRRLMREHDVFVFGSDGYEGWGAVVNEALEEGMYVISSRQAGAGATILPEECLFDAGDVKAISRLLCSAIPRVGIGNWNVKKAALALKELCDAL